MSTSKSASAPDGGAAPTSTESPAVIKVDMAVSLLCLAAWISLFLAGLLVNSGPLRDQLVTVSPIDSFGQFLKAFLATVCTYTITNICFLAILASLLGDVASRVGIGPDASEAHAPKDATHPRTSALLRGFFVYLAFLAGVVVISDNPLNPSQDQYWRIGGALSLAAFLASARPGRVTELISRAPKTEHRPTTPG